MNSEVFETAFDDAFFEVTVKAEDLFVKLDKGGFELLVDVAAKMVWVMVLRKGLARVSLFRSEVGC